MQNGESDAQARRLLCAAISVADGWDWRLSQPRVLPGNLHQSMSQADEKRMLELQICDLLLLTAQRAVSRPCEQSIDVQGHAERLCVRDQALDHGPSSTGTAIRSELDRPSAHGLQNVEARNASDRLGPHPVLQGDREHLRLIGAAVTFLLRLRRILMAQSNTTETNLEAPMGALRLCYDDCQQFVTLCDRPMMAL